MHPPTPGLYIPIQHVHTQGVTSAQSSDIMPPKVVSALSSMHPTRSLYFYNFCTHQTPWEAPRGGTHPAEAPAAARGVRGREVPTMPNSKNRKQTF